MGDPVMLSALVDNPFVALCAHSHWLLKANLTGLTTILTERGVAVILQILLFLSGVGIIDNRIPSVSICLVLSVS
jgi:hypothetical protein